MKGVMIDTKPVKRTSGRKRFPLPECKTAFLGMQAAQSRFTYCVWHYYDSLYSPCLKLWSLK